jgi:hypothetical protein
MKEALSITLMGLFLIIVLDILGSIASRKFGFKYVYLAPISFVIYIVVSFLITKNINWITALIVTAFLGIFDATIGWKLAIFFKANAEQKYEITASNVFRVLKMIMIFGIVGVVMALI